MAFGFVNIGGVAFALDKTLSLDGTAADAKAVGDELAKKLDKTGGEMKGYLDFKQTSTGLRWTLANGDRFDFRPWSPTNVFQLTRTVAGNKIPEYGVLNVDGDGNIYFGVPTENGSTINFYIKNDGGVLCNGPVQAERFIGKVPWSNLENVPDYLPKSGGEITGAISFGQRTRGIEWKLANGDVYELRPYVDNNVFQLVRCPADGTAPYGVMDIYEDGTINFACHRDKKSKSMGSIHEDGFYGDLHGTADKAKAVPWSGVTDVPDILLKTGGAVTGYLDFAQTNTGLRWTLANGDRYDFRPWSPNNIFQLTRTTADGKTPEYGVINVDAEGNIYFCTPNGDSPVPRLTITEDGIHGDLHGTADSAKSAENGVVASGAGYIRFGDGTQICWEADLSMNAGEKRTFPMAFISNPALSLTFRDSTGVTGNRCSIYWKDLDSTSFIMGTTNSYAFFAYVAVGRWK